MNKLKTRTFFSLVLGLFLWFIICPTISLAAGKEVTPEQLQAVFSAYKRSAAQNFSPESMVEIYDLDNAVSAVKKLVDFHQSNPTMSIPPKHRDKMQETRKFMDLTVMRKIAKITGRVETLNFGKLNGIRSDDDQTMFPVDGKRYYTGAEIAQAKQRLFKETWGIDFHRMDMETFDGGAYVPDWRDSKMTFAEFRRKYAEGEAKLSQNEAAYLGGAYRAQVDRRSADKGRVTIIIYKGTDKNGKDVFEELIDVPAAEFSARYKDWKPDVPFRNAMDSVHQNLDRFKHSPDFIDKMKYFNRTIGDGINALAMENWNVDYIHHLKKLSIEGRRAEMDDFIRNMVNDVFAVDLSDADREHFFSVIKLAAEIEVDKMRGQTRSEGVYLRRIIADVEKEAASENRTLKPDEKIRLAREKFFSFQERVMKYNLAATARQKIQLDFSKQYLQMVSKKYGKEQAQKLKWESAMQLKRIFNEINDDVLIRRIISDAPDEVKGTLTKLHELARSRRTSDDGRISQLAKCDPEEARRSGPKELEVSKKKGSFVDMKEKIVNSVCAAIKRKYQEFDADLRSGRYSDAAITQRMKDDVLDALGFEERMVMRNMEAEFEKRFSGKKLLSNVLTLGNVDSAINMIRVYQQTGDWDQVIQTAVWELVSNVPGVSQMALLKQAYNDGDYRGLAWMFIAWKMPVAGQVKMVFDIVKGSMEIFYHHLMDPLSNDRFSLVYMGYIEKQPAGWSPFQPGWKERQEALADSILHFVPGETFPEKRNNMFKYFQAKLDRVLRAEGRVPTSTEYWVKRDEMLQGFFQQYINDYFEARGEWSGNVLAGLRGMSQEKEIKDKLLQCLLMDFRNSEKFWEDMHEARWQMEDLMKQKDRIIQKNIQIEKKIAAAEDFLAEQLHKAQMEALNNVEKVERKFSRIKAEAYPPVVSEGQEATFEVKVMSHRDETVEPGGHSIEIKPTKVKPVFEGTIPDPEEMEQKLDEPEYIELMAQELKEDHRALYVTELTYDVVVKDLDGNILGKTLLSLDLAGAGPKGKELFFSGCSIPDDGIYCQDRVTWWKYLEHDDVLIEGYRKGEIKRGSWVGPFIAYYDEQKKNKLCQGCFTAEHPYHRIIGKYTEWYENGKKKIECTFISKGGISDDPFSEPTDALYQIRNLYLKYGYDVETPFHGPVLFWYEDGTPYLEYHFTDGKQDGLQKENFRSEQTLYKSEYKLGKKHGWSRKWEKNRLRWEEKYENNRLIISRYYCPDGKRLMKEASYQYSGDKQYGSVRRFDCRTGLVEKEHTTVSTVISDSEDGEDHPLIRGSKLTTTGGKPEEPEDDEDHPLIKGSKLPSEEEIRAKEEQELQQQRDAERAEKLRQEKEAEEKKRAAELRRQKEAARKKRAAAERRRAEEEKRRQKEAKRKQPSEGSEDSILGTTECFCPSRALAAQSECINRCRASDNVTPDCYSRCDAIYQQVYDQCMQKCRAGK